MAKNVRKLQLEIDRGLKQTDEGIITLVQLNEKLENANSLQMKEKYEQDMKKEVKKLQRWRDFFRQGINSTEIKDKTKLQDARKRIELEMEKFREHEKEYKQKKLTKSAMQNISENEGKFKFDSGDEDEDQYGSDIESSDNGISGDENDYSGGEGGDIDKDKEWLAHFLSDSLKQVIAKYEGQLDTMRNKKKGGAKKNKDKLNQITKHHDQSRLIRERAGELEISMDYLDGGQIRQLQIFCKQMLQNPDDDQLRTKVVREIDHLIEVSEQNRKFQQNNNPTHFPDQNGQSGQEKLKQLDALNLQNTKDVVRETLKIGQLRPGQILDGQDYLGHWHLMIVLDEDGDKRHVHFLPFHKANRDEDLEPNEHSRVASAFYHTDLPEDTEASLGTLRQYYSSYLTNHGKQPQAAAPNARQAPEEQKGPAPTQPKGKSESAKATQESTTRYNSTQEQSNLQSKGKLTKGQLQQHQDTGTSSQAINPALSGKAQPAKDEHVQGDLGHKAKQDGGSTSAARAATEPVAAAGITMAPMFQGNPFALKGLRKPEGLGGLPSIPLPSTSVIESDATFDQKQQSFQAQEPVEEKPSKRVSGHHRQQQVLNLLDASFQNMPAPWDQEVIDPKQPIPIQEEHKYPTVPLFSRKDNFAKFDLETLFFAFYYQQGTYQQYMAAVELKKKKWIFQKKFETWFKKADGKESRTQSATTDGAVQKDVGKYVFFDYENGWQQRVGDDIAIDLTQIENELQVQPTTHSGAPISASGRVSQ